MGRRRMDGVQRSPDGYPDAVTLSPRAKAHAVLGRVEGGAGCSVKDSFAVLDLEPWGFHVLFDATWIRRSAAEAVPPATLDWRRHRRLPSSNSGPTDTISTFLIRRCWTSTIFGSFTPDGEQMPVSP